MALNTGGAANAPHEKANGCVPRLDFDPYDATVLANPYPHYERLRDAGPISWSEEYQVYAVGRFETVKRVLTDHESFCSSAGVGLTNFLTEEPWRKPSIILEVDPPEHTRTRKVFSRILSPRALNDLRERFEAVAESMVVELVERGEIDGAQDLAAAYPLKVFADAVGVPAEGRRHLLPYGDMVFNAFGPRNQRFHDCFEKLGPSTEWINAACQRENLTDNGFGAALYAAADAGEITAEEAAMLVRTMLSAGLDTTIFTIANAIACFLQNPEQWNTLHTDPNRARSAVEEVLRYEPTFHSFYRTTTRPLNLEGVEMGRNQKILVFIGSANRDPRHWQDANTFDITRRPSPNMAFGTGIHGCAGQMIARLESEIVFRTLARHVRAITPNGSANIHFNNTVRGYSQLPVRLDRAN